jgi:hypothetical protein
MWRTTSSAPKWSPVAVRFLVALAALCPTLGHASLDTPYQKKQVALTISGGVSLGSYEAGVNWALTHVLREANADLAVVTGASAGNINTLLTAYSWCGLDDASGGKPEQSLFWKAWIPVGLDGLVPRAFESGYRAGDGLFTRRAFDGSIENLKELVKTPATRDCALRLGITLSRREPGNLQIDAGPNHLEIPAMRYVVPFEAQAKQGQLLKFSSPTREQVREWKLKELGLYLTPSEPGHEVALDPSLLDYIQAASAFPYAFGSINLNYWAPLKEGEPYTPSHDVFLDGGVFDNVPVGLSLRLLPEPIGGDKNPRFIFYIDPDQHPSSTTPAPTKPLASVPLAGFSSVLDFLNGAVNSARKQELQNVARYELDGENVQLRLTTRMTNVFGEYYAAFGAFTDVRFRSMDFYLGLFDGLMSFAEWECEGSAPADACVVARVVNMKKSLALDSASPNAAYVVDQLLTRKYPAEAGRQQVSPHLPEAESAGLSPQEVKVMLKVLAGKEQNSFASLLAALREAGAREQMTWHSFIIDDPNGFFAEYTNRMLLRALWIEQINGRQGSLRPLTVANLVARSVLPQRDFEWDPSSIPDGKENYHTVGSTVGHVLPYYLGFEFMPKGEFGFRAQWRPTLPLGSRLRLTLPGDAGWMGVSNGFRAGLGLGAKLVIVPSIGLSADASGGAGWWGRDISAAMRLGSEQLKVDGSVQAGLTLFESFRLGYTYYTGPKLHSVSLGLMDFNGISYWLARTAANK